MHTLHWSKNALLLFINASPLGLVSNTLEDLGAIPFRRSCGILPKFFGWPVEILLGVSNNPIPSEKWTPQIQPHQTLLSKAFNESWN